MHDFKKKVITGFAWEGGTKFVIQILSWVSTVIVARLLTPDDYGIVAVSGIFILLMSHFAEMGLAAGLINKKEISDKEITGVFWFGIFLSFFLYLIIALISPLVETIFGMEGLGDLMMASALMVIFASFRIVASAKIMREMNYKFRALVDMFGQFVMIVVTLFLAYSGYGPWSLILGTVAMHLFITLAYIPHMKGIGFVAIHWSEIKSVISYGLNVMASRLLGHFSSNTPVFIVGLLLGQKSTGYYSFAEQIGKMPMDKIGMLFNRIIFPATSRVKENTDYARNVFIKMHQVLFLIGSPILIGLSIVCNDLVILLFTDKWSDSIPILELTALLNLFVMSSMIMPPVIEGMGKPEILVRYNVLNLMLLVTASLIGIQWGLVGMVISWFFVYPIVYIYLLSRVMRILDLKFIQFAKTMIPAIVSLTVMVAVLFVLQVIMTDESVLLRLIAMIIGGACTYIGVFLLVFRSEANELKHHIVKGFS